MLHFESYRFGLIIFEENNVFSKFDIIGLQNAFCAKDLLVIAANIGDGTVPVGATQE